MTLKKILVKPEPTRSPSWLDKAEHLMDKEDYEYLIQCLNDISFSNTYLAKKITEAGYPVSRTTIADIRARRLNG